MKNYLLVIMITIRDHNTTWDHISEMARTYLPDDDDAPIAIREAFKVGRPPLTPLTRCGTGHTSRGQGRRQY
jgi:hypothetical protein